MATNNSHTYSRFWVAILLLLTFSVGILLGIKLQTQKMISIVQPSKIEEVLRYTESWYVDEVDRGQIIQKAIESVANNKTGKSKKVTSVEVKKLIQTIDNNYEGSGIDVSIIADTLLLLKPTKIGDGLIYQPY